MDANNNALAILRRAVLPSRRDSDKTRAVAVGALPSPLLSTPISTTIIAFSTQQQQGRTATDADTSRAEHTPPGRPLPRFRAGQPCISTTNQSMSGRRSTHVRKSHC